MLTEETKTTITIIRHINLVQRFMNRIAQALEKRALIHDQSKFSEDEFGGFVQINRIAREHKYGSPEYKESLKQVDAVEKHYSRNSHHPEYHPGGVGDMSLFDIIEMVCDWKAAAETYSQSTLEESLPIQVERFKLTPEQVYLVKLIVRELDK